MRTGHQSLSIVLVGFVIAFAGFLVTSSADAQNAKKATPATSADLVTASSLDAIMASLQKAGFSVKISTDSSGDPLIQSTDANEPFSVYFYGCTAGKNCEYIQFVQGWHLTNGTTPDVIEQWNEKYVWGRAYIDAENDPWIDMPVNLKGGVTTINFDDTVGWWSSVIHDFESHIGFNLNKPFE